MWSKWIWFHWPDVAGAMDVLPKDPNPAVGAAGWPKVPSPAGWPAVAEFANEKPGGAVVAAVAVVPKPPNAGAEGTADVPKPIKTWRTYKIVAYSFCENVNKCLPVDPNAEVWPKAGAAPKPVLAVVVAVPNATMQKLK